MNERLEVAPIPTIRHHNSRTIPIVGRRLRNRETISLAGHRVATICQHRTRNGTEAGLLVNDQNDYWHARIVARCRAGRRRTASAAGKEERPLSGPCSEFGLSRTFWSLRRKDASVGGSAVMSLNLVNLNSSQIARFLARSRRRQLHRAQDGPER